MKIPDRLSVGPYCYRIELVDVVDKNNRDLCGQARHMEEVIRIEKDMSLIRTEETFLHEVVHCAEVFMRLDLPEDTVNRISTGLYMIFKQNDLLK